MCETGYTYLADHVSESCGGEARSGAGVGSSPVNEDNIQDEDGGNEQDEGDSVRLSLLLILFTGWLGANKIKIQTSGASNYRWDSALPASLGVLHLCYAILDGLIRI